MLVKQRAKFALETRFPVIRLPVLDVWSYLIEAQSGSGAGRPCRPLVTVAISAGSRPIEISPLSLEGFRIPARRICSWKRLTVRRVASFSATATWNS
jgi:hypothetical protein